jgi:hypothetical protein
MVRACVYVGLVCLLLGAIAGWKLKPEAEGRLITAVQRGKTVTVTKTVEKETKPDGTVTERTTTRRAKTVKQAAAATPIPRPDYRVGIHSRQDLTPSVSAGRRLFGNVWLEGSYHPHSKSATLGFSYEF